MNKEINSKINFLKVTIKRKLEVIGEVLSSEEISNYNEREKIISEINFFKLIIERNLKKICERNLKKIEEALETEKISNYNTERNESNKIIVKYLRANSFWNWLLDMPISKYTHEEIIEHRCYLTGKSKEMKAMFTSSQNRFNKSRIKFINQQQYYKK